jgi:alpha-1,3-rhamnosyl/mannosyltransferase
MPALYSGAQFYIFTPIYEGFGMSPMEAYACGTPVIASNVASVPEAAGDAAMYVDPYDVNDIKQKMLKMFDLTKKDRGQFKPKMESFLQEHNWRKSTEITASYLTGLPISYFINKENN